MFIIIHFSVVGHDCLGADGTWGPSLIPQEPLHWVQEWFLLLVLTVSLSSITIMYLLCMTCVPVIALLPQVGVT